MGKLLVIEKSKLFQKIISQAINDQDHDVIYSDSLIKSLELLASEKPDAICMTNHVLDGSVEEFTEECRQTSDGKDIPIILILSKVDEEEKETYLKAGVTSVFGRQEQSEFHKEINNSLKLQRKDDNVSHLSTENKGRVLYVEDSKIVAKMTIKLLQEKMNLEISHFVNASHAFEHLEKNEVDIIITDILLEGNLTGVDLTKKVRDLKEPKSQLPILAMTGFDDAERRLELYRSGVNDYATKPVIEEEFTSRVNNLLSNKLLFDQVKEQQKQLYNLAMTDQLTGCYNRHSLAEFSPKYFSSAARKKVPISVMIFDLDHFKNINDTYGHDVGDIVLKEVGKLVRAFFREEDFVVRFGGEEFLVLLQDCNGDDAVARGEEVRKEIEKLKPNKLDISASIGVTTLEPEVKGVEFEDLFKCADKAVYHSKENGRNQVTFTPYKKEK